MDEKGQKDSSHAFILRLWEEQLGLGQAEWRGQLHHIQSGQTHYFREWQMLIQLLLHLLNDTEPHQEQS